jgi:hypothetical protein
VSLFSDDAEDRAEKLLGDAGIISSWTQIAGLPLDNVRFPAAVAIRINGNAFESAIDIGHFRIGVTADDATVYVFGPQEVEPGDVVTIQLPRKPGSRLELWADRSEGASFRVVTPQEGAAAERARDASADKGFSLGTGGTVVAAAAAVVAIALAVVSARH